MCCIAFGCNEQQLEYFLSHVIWFDQNWRQNYAKMFENGIIHLIDNMSISI